MLVDQNYIMEKRLGFQDLVELDQLKQMFHSFSEATYYFTKLVSHPDQELLVDTKSNKKTEIFSSNDHLNSACKINRLEIFSDLNTSQKPLLRKCENGLYEGAIAVYVEELHLANIFLGHVQVEKPDKKWLTQKAKELNCDIELLVQEFLKIPLVEKKQIKQALIFLRDMASMLAQKGLAEKRIIKAKQITEESKEKFSKLFSESPAMIALSDLESGECLDVNQAFLNTLGYTKQEVIGAKECGVLRLDEESAQIIKQKLEREGFVKNFKTVLQSKSQHPIHVLLSAEILTINNQTIKFITAIDISQHIKAEHELYIKTRAMDFAPVGISISDPHQSDNPLIYVNKKFKELTGYESEEVIGMNCRFLQGEETQLGMVYKMKEAIHKQKPVTVDIVNYRKDGTAFWNRVTIAPIHNKEGEIESFIGFQEDVTEQKKAEKVQAAHTSFIENSKDIFVIKDLNLKVVTTNMAYVNASGSSRVEDLIGKSDFEIFDTSRDKQPLSLLREEDLKALSLNKGDVTQCEHPIFFPDGEERSFLTRKFPIYDAIGQLIYIGIISTDVTDQKRLREELKAREVFLQHILDASAVGILYLKARKIQWGNKALLKMLKVDDVEDHVGKSTSIFFPSIIDYERHIKWIYSYKSKSKLIEYDAKLRRMDGTILDGLIKVNQINVTPNEEELIVSIVDISDRKKMEEVLRESEYKFRMLFEHSPLGIFIADSNGDILHANKALLKMFDVNLFETKQINLLTFKPLVDVGYSKAFQDCIETGKMKKTQNEYPKKKGVQRVFSSYLIPMKNDRGEIESVYTLMEEITEQIQAESMIQRMQKLESVGTLAGGIAHDFNNLLMGIYGKIGLAKDELPKFHSAYDLLEEAENSMNRASRLTKQLLTFAKGGNPVKEDYYIQDLIKEIAAFDLSGSQIKAVINHSDELWSANVDKGQIQQVFSNLIINASQAMPNGGHLYISIENQVIVEANPQKLKPGNYLKLTFLDEGVGIEPKDIQYIFDPYFTTKQAGSGLGLATSYSIVCKHGGAIEVQSEQGKGACFILYLPAITTHQKTKGGIKTLNPHKDSTEPLKILVMDDDELVLEVIIDVLNKKGYNVDSVTNGADLIKTYQLGLEKKTPYDLVIMDLTIPGGMGGKEAIGELMKIDSCVTAIVSSGFTNDSILSSYKEYGFKGYLEKPFGPKKLLHMINSVLEHREY